MDNVRNRARELIPYMNTPNFKEVFAEIVSEAGGNADFLLKMELRRITGFPIFSRRRMWKTS